MPAIIPVILPLLGAVAGGVGSLVTGLAAGGGSGGPSAADQQKQLQEAQLKQAQADQQAKQKAILASLPNAQEQGGGSLSAPSLTDLASVIAGLPGESTTSSGKGALSAFLGTPVTPSGNENMVSATYGLSGSQG